MVITQKIGKKSLITKKLDRCIICGSPYVEIHHVMYGTGYRKLSDRYGLIIPLCREHHTGNSGIHFNKDMDQFYKKLAQKKFEEEYSHEEYMKIFGRNYL